MGLGTAMWYAIPTIVIVYVIRKYRESKWGKCTNNVLLERKIVLITGANSGLGYECAKEFYKRGATVIMACRDKIRAKKAIELIKKSTKSKGHLVFVELNLASLQSVINCCKKVCEQYEKIDILVNNAGLSQPLKSKLTTKDGFELHIGVNYIGHFMLTNLLLPLLSKSSEARIINVSSLLHQRATLHLEDLNFDNRPLNHPYAESKLLLIYFGQELAKKIFEKKFNINVYNLCPGWVYTNLFRHSLRNWFKLIFAIPVALFFMRTAKQGAQTIIYCATEPALSSKSGLLYRDCNKYTSTYQFHSSDRSQLWVTTQNMIEQKGFQLMPF